MNEDKKVKCYKVAWDNGTNASGIFSLEHPTSEEADLAGQNWAIDMNAIDPVTDEEDEGYTYEVAECYIDGTYELL